MTLFEQYKTALELLEKESDRFWTRNNILLLVQGAFISFYASTIKSNSIYSLLLASQGIILAFIWIGILMKGAQYVERWDKCVRELEKMILATGNLEFQGLKRLNDIAKRAEVKPKFPLSLLNKRTTVLIRYLIISLSIFWIIIFTLSLLNLLFFHSCIQETPKIFHLLNYYGHL